MFQTSGPLTAPWGNVSWSPVPRAVNCLRYHGIDTIHKQDRLLQKTLPHLITYYVCMKVTWEIWLEKVIKLRTTKLKFNYLGAVIPGDSLLLKNLLQEWVQLWGVDQPCKVVQGLPGEGGLAVSVSSGPSGAWLCVPANRHVHSRRPVLVLLFTYCFLS